MRSAARASCWRAWRMTDPATPQRDQERRRLNVMEALIIAALLGIGGLIFRLNDSVTRLQVSSENTNRQPIALPGHFAELTTITQRVTNTDGTQDCNHKKQLNKRNTN